MHKLGIRVEQVPRQSILTFLRLFPRLNQIILIQVYLLRELVQELVLYILLRLLDKSHLIYIVSDAVPQVLDSFLFLLGRHLGELFPLLLASVGNAPILILEQISLFGQNCIHL